MRRSRSIRDHCSDRGGHRRCGHRCAGGAGRDGVRARRRAGRASADAERHRALRRSTAPRRARWRIAPAPARCASTTSGEHLVAPGTGLYAPPRAASWPRNGRSVELPGACHRLDRVGRRPRRPAAASSGRRTTGPRRRSAGSTSPATVAATATTVDAHRGAYRTGAPSRASILLADQRTIYYGLDGGDEIKRYDVCDRHAAGPVRERRPSLRSTSRVRPNGQVAVTCDTYGSLFDLAGVSAA